MAVVRPTRVYLLYFFCSGNQFYVLLSHIICFISFIYLDLNVLDEHKLGVFHEIQCLFVLWYFFCGSFYVFSLLCLLCFVRVCLYAPGKWLTSWLSFVVSNCEFITFPLVSLVRLYLIVTIPDLCNLTYFDPDVN